ncbi:MAG TPA: AAA family ATPase [bacterium]|nr:AAA family ATPase [bacterium]HPJ71057.1 AAA family ATPase [bacterium]HPQ66469.1 AAA family ATPase [bacterium]
MSKPVRLYVSATRQNDGKTIVSLGLINSLRKRFDPIGYIKPVGQQYLDINGERIDKDVVLMQRIYAFADPLAAMSPVAIPRGFTEDYIRNPYPRRIKQLVVDSFNRVAEGKSLTLIEGTGHAGVGSVFDLSNAEVARLLEAKVIIVSLGGVGKPIDEILLNKSMFDHYGVEILGVILNKVRGEKFDKVNTLVRKSLESRGLKVLGIVPFDQVLSIPTLREIIWAIKGELISGHDRIDAQTGKYVIGAMPLSTALDFFTGRYLLITPGNREDLIMASLTHALTEDQTDTDLSGIILTGGILPHRNILRLIRKTGYPLVAVKDDTYTITSKIAGLQFKIKPESVGKIAETQTLIENNVDIDLLERLLRGQ